MQWDPPLSRALGRGINLLADPASSAGAKSRNVPFRVDIVESVFRTTVSVANSHPSILPLWRWLMLMGHDAFPETLPRVRITTRNGIGYVDPW